MSFLKEPGATPSIDFASEARRVVRAWCPVFMLVPDEGHLGLVFIVWNDLSGLLSRLQFEADDGRILEQRLRDRPEDFRADFLELLLFFAKELGYSKCLLLRE